MLASSVFVSLSDMGNILGLWGDMHLWSPVIRSKSLLCESESGTEGDWEQLLCSHRVSGSFVFVQVQNGSMYVSLAGPPVYLEGVFQ